MTNDEVRRALRITRVTVDEACVRLGLSNGTVHDEPYRLARVLALGFEP